MVISQNLAPVQTEMTLGTAEEEEKGPQALENDDYYPEEHDLDNFRELDEEEQAYLRELEVEKNKTEELKRQQTIEAINW